MDSVDVDDDDDDDDDDALEIFAILFSLKSLTHAQVFFFLSLRGRNVFFGRLVSFYFVVLWLCTFYMESALAWALLST